MKEYTTECGECDSDVSVDYDDVLNELDFQCECGNTISACLNFGTVEVVTCESCQEGNYNNGYSDGKEEGYDSGYDVGFEEGYADAQKESYKNE